MTSAINFTTQNPSKSTFSSTQFSFNKMLRRETNLGKDHLNKLIKSEKYNQNIFSILFSLINHNATIVPLAKLFKSEIPSAIKMKHILALQHNFPTLQFY